MAKKPSDRARPRAQRKRGIRPIVIVPVVLGLETTAHESSQQRFVGIADIGSGYGVAAKQKSSRSRTSQKSMQEETAVAYGEHDFSRLYFIDGTGCDFDYIAGPERRQHAFAAHAEAQTSRGPQTFGGDSGTLGEAGFTETSYRNGGHEASLRDNDRTSCIASGSFSAEAALATDRDLATRQSRGFENLFMAKRRLLVRLLARRNRFCRLVLFVRSLAVLHRLVKALNRRLVSQNLCFV